VQEKSAKRIYESGEAEGENDAEYFARSRAMDSATCALPRAKNARIVIFEVEMHDAEIVEPDEPCEGMAGAVCVFDDVPASAIKGVWISEDLSLVKGYFLAMTAGRDLSAYDLSPAEEKVCAVFKKAEIYPEDIETMASLVKLPKKKKSGNSFDK
jgi:hypothetical protein